MNIVQLEYFLAASQTLNYTRAAQEMFTSRQNLSHAIHDLEKELGAKLFTQSGTKLALTVEGVEAAKHTRRVVQEIAALKEACAPKEKPSDPLRVDVCTNLISCTNYDIGLSLDRYDGVIRLSEWGCRKCYEDIVCGDADVAVIGCMERSFPKCEHVLLHRDLLYLLVSETSELAQKSELKITDLDGHRICLLPEYDFQFEVLSNAYMASGLDVDNIDVISNVGLMLRSVRWRELDAGQDSLTLWSPVRHA